MQEYPKALYRGDDFVIVEDAEAEKKARADGYAMIGEASKKAKK